MFQKLALLFLIGASLTACQQPTSNKLTPVVPYVQEKAAVPFSLPQVDVLFVVDQSGSMGKHQDNLSANVKRFTEELGRLSLVDYQIAVLSSSVNLGTPAGGPDPGANGNFIKDRFITSNEVNGLAELEADLIVGITGEGNEMFSKPVLMAVDKAKAGTSPQKEFFREGATLAVFFITDAKDHSEESIDEVINQLVAFKGSPSKVLVYGAIVPTGVPNAECTRDQPDEEPSEIEELIRRTNGQYFSLCDSDFGGLLANSARDLMAKVGTRLLLGEWPGPNTIRVFFQGSEVPNDPVNGWSYDPVSNSIQIGPNFDPGTVTDGELQVIFDPATVSE